MVQTGFTLHLWIQVRIGYGLVFENPSAITIDDVHNTVGSHMFTRSGVHRNPFQTNRDLMPHSTVWDCKSYSSQQLGRR